MGGVQPGAPTDVLGQMHHARRILLVPNDRVGGLFYGGGCYGAVRQRFPQAHIHLLTDRPKSSLARQIPGLDEVVEAHWQVPLRSVAFRQSQEALQARAYDLVLSLGADCSYALAALCGSSGAPLRIGYARGTMRPFNVELQKPERVYEGHSHGGLLRLLGAAAGGQLKWAVPADTVQRARERYLDGRRPGSGVVALDLQPGEDGQLSLGQYKELIELFLARSTGVVLFGAASQRQALLAMQQRYAKRLWTFEVDDLLDAGALLCGAGMLIACNTELLHLALALGVRAVALHGADPGRWAAPGNDKVHLVAFDAAGRVRLGRIAEAYDECLARSAVEA